MKRPITLIWLPIVFGLLVAPAVAIGVDLAQGTVLTSAVSKWARHLFEPGYNEFLLAVYAAAPYLVIAIFAWIHFDAGTHQRKRQAGVVGAFGLGVFLTLSGLVGIRTSRSSTAAIGYLFLPFYVLLFAMPIGYIAGRLVARLWLTQTKH